MSKWIGSKEAAKRARAYNALANPDSNRRMSRKLAVASADLELKTEGKIIRQGDADYHVHRHVNSSWDFEHFPLLIAYCETFSDIKTCLRCARENDIPVVVRASGHNTAGFSVNDGLVIDVSKMVYTLMGDDLQAARISGGVRSGHLNTALEFYGRHVVSGGCRSVRLAGFVQGGGYGYTSRMYGLGCDNVLEARVMLADGGVVVANEQSNSDLYWALRGGSGNNFGVLLDVQYKVHNPGNMCGFRVWWKLGSSDDNERGARVLDHMQRNHMRGDQRLKRLGYQAFVCWQRSKKGEEPALDGWYVLLRGMYPGTLDELEESFMKEIRTFAPPTAKLFLKDSTYRAIDVFTHEDPAVPQVDDAAREDKQSVYIDKTVGTAGWREIIERFITDNPNSGNLLGIEPYGGAIEIDPTQTAFIHRDVDMDLYVDTFWMEQAKKPEAVRYLTEYMRFLEDRGWSNGRSYQNYMREALTDYRSRYWGDSFFSLRAIKRKYDPDDFFQHPQGILASKGDPVYDDPPRGTLHPKVYPHLQGALSQPISYLIKP